MPIIIITRPGGAPSVSSSAVLSPTWIAPALTQSGGDKIYYVSSTDGNDANNGLVTTPNPTNIGGPGAPGPFATIPHAAAQMANNSADWVLMKCGDTFLDQQVDMAVNGRSPAQCLLFSTYGAGARPLWSNTDAHYCFTISSNGDNLVIEGLNMYCRSRDPTNLAAFSITDAHTAVADAIFGQYNVYHFYVVVENCEISYFEAAIRIANSGTPTPYHQPAGSTFIVNGCSIHDTYSPQNVGLGHAQGVVDGASRKLIATWNLFDCCGWSRHLGGSGVANDGPGWNPCSINGTTLTWTSSTVAFPLANGDTVWVQTSQNGLTISTDYVVASVNAAAKTFVISAATGTGTVNIAWKDVGHNEFDHSIYHTGFYTSNGGANPDYLAYPDPPDIKWNIFARDASGNALRAGGHIDNNLFLMCDYGFAWGPGLPANNRNPQYSITNNVCIHGLTNSKYQPAVGVLSSEGFMASNFTFYSGDGNNYNGSGTLVQNNLLMHNYGGGNGITMNGVDNGVPAPGNNTWLNNTCFDWPGLLIGAVAFDPGGTDTASGDFSQGSDAAIGGFADQDRTCGKYNSTLPGNSGSDDFAYLTDLRAQIGSGRRRQSWNSAYSAPSVNNYLRLGCGKTAI